MSARKDTLLHKIRKQFESKYRHYPHILDQLDQELEELSYKSKISKDDLDALEARLLRGGQSNYGHNKSHSIDSPYRGNLDMPTEGDEDNTLPVQKIQHHRNKSSLENENTPQKKPDAFKIVKGRLSHTPGLCDNSLYYMSPMDIAVLKKGGLIEGGIKSSAKKRINATYIEEFERSDSPPARVAKSFMADESIEMDQNNIASGKKSGLRPIVGVPNLLKTEKMIEREKMIKADLWHKIEDFRVKQFDNQEKQKAVENKKLTQKWINDLQRQVEDNKIRKEREKKRDLIAGIKHVESETALQQEHMNKEKRYKEYRSLFEKNSQLANVRARMEQNQMKQYEKDQDSIDLQKEQIRYEMAVGKDRRSQSRDASELQRRMISREEEKPMKAWIQREEKEMLMRKKYVEFLKEKGLYHQSSKHSEDHLRNKKRYIPIEQANDSILKFMNADHHTEVGRTRMRRNLRDINDTRQEQTIDKNMKEIIEIEHIKEQKTLWKAQEDQLEIREKLTKEAEKLKKLVQKQALDAQIEQDRALKKGPITDKEQRINRSILRLID